MVQSYKLVLTTEQLGELEWARDHHSKPYVRERAAAILKVAEGQSIRQVALNGLLKRREPAFSPQHTGAEEAAAELQEVIRRSPRLYGLKRSRWWLDGLRQVVNWLRGLSLAGVHKLLRRLGIRYKRGRRYVHSPTQSMTRRWPSFKPFVS